MEAVKAIVHCHWLQFFREDIREIPAVVIDIAGQGMGELKHPFLVELIVVGLEEKGNEHENAVPVQFGNQVAQLVIRPVLTMPEGVSFMCISRSVFGGKDIFSVHAWMENDDILM